MSEEEDFTQTTPAEVVLIVEECKDSVTIAEWACRAISSFTKTAIVTRNREAMAQLLDEGICECLMSIMHTHSASSVVVSMHGCQALCDLTKSDRELREFLGDLGACELCVFVMEMHVGLPDITVPGSAAMINLCTDNIRNSHRLSEAGACDILVQSGNFGFNLRHPQCAAVAANICDAISHLCEAANQGKLQESGACELIVALFKFHLENEQVCEPATKAFCGLASLTAENREILGKAGGCLLIVQAMQESSNTLIIEHCAESMLHMALSVNNTERLTQAGACVVLMKVLDTVLLDRNFGAEICCGALMNMVTYGTSAKENIENMRDAGVLDLMARVQSSTRSSYRARDNASQLVTYVTASAATPSITTQSRAKSSSSLNTLPISGAQQFQSSLPASANSSPRTRKSGGQQAQQQSPFFASFSSFAEKGKRSLGSLSSSTMASSSNTTSGSSSGGGGTSIKSNSSPITNIFNNLFDSKNNRPSNNNNDSDIIINNNNNIINNTNASNTEQQPVCNTSTKMATDVSITNKATDVKSEALKIEASANSHDNDLLLPARNWAETTDTDENDGDIYEI